MSRAELNISLLMALKEKPCTTMDVKVLSAIVKDLVEEVELLRSRAALTAEEIDELRKTYNH